MAPTTNQRPALGPFISSGLRASHTALYMLYLLLSAALFGGLLLSHRIWRTRCRDAVELLHTASSLLQQYGGMDGTKTVEYKASLNETISRVLDNKLPVVISRACVGGRPRRLQVPNFADTKRFQVQMDDFYNRPALVRAYVAFFVCHLAFVLIMHMKLYTRWWTTHATRLVSPRFAAGNHYAFADVALQDSIACGLTMGYDAASLVNVLLQVSYFTSSRFEDVDGFDLITVTGLSFSLLLVVGALVSASYPSHLGIVYRARCQDVEMNPPWETSTVRTRMRLDCAGVS